MAEDLVLRRAGRADAELLLRWRNDPGTRRASFHTEEIPWETHCAWLEKTLADPRRRLYILEKDGKGVGQLRLDIAGSEAEISYLIAPERRGEGLGTELIRLTVRHADRLLGQEAGERPVKELLALVRKDNPASCRVFERCGFTGSEGSTGSERVYRLSINREEPTT